MGQKFLSAIIANSKSRKMIEKENKEQERRFCPKCKSENVEVGVAPVGIPNLAALGPINKCLDCGFEAMIFPEKFKLEIEKDKKQNDRRKR